MSHLIKVFLIRYRDSLICILQNKIIYNAGYELLKQLAFM